MKDFLKKFFDITFLKFVLVGVVNTLFGYGITVVCLNLLNLSYEISTAANVVLASILSYFLNRFFTFNSQKHTASSAVRFVINIAGCYLLAYYAPIPLFKWIFPDMEKKLFDNILGIVGQCLFIGFNYIGQRFFVFRSTNVEKQ